MKNSRFTLYRIVIIGLMAAMVFVCTMFLGIRIPTPTGTTQLKTANAICLLTGIIVYALQRRRLHQREREIQRQRLDNLLATQQELNRRNERLSAELEQAAHTCAVSRLRPSRPPTPTSSLWAAHKLPA